MLTAPNDEVEDWLELLHESCQYRPARDENDYPTSFHVDIRRSFVERDFLFEKILSDGSNVRGIDAKDEEALFRELESNTNQDYSTKLFLKVKFQDVVMRTCSIGPASPEPI